MVLILLSWQKHQHLQWTPVLTLTFLLLEVGGEGSIWKVQESLKKFIQLTSSLSGMQKGSVPPLHRRKKEKEVCCKQSAIIRQLGAHMKWQSRNGGKGEEVVEKVDNTKKKMTGNKQWAGRNRARHGIEKQVQTLRAEEEKRQSEKKADEFCWSSSLLLSQLMLSCHLQELIGTSSVKTQACVLILTNTLHTTRHCKSLLRISKIKVETKGLNNSPLYLNRTSSWFRRS